MITGSNVNISGFERKGKINITEKDLKKKYQDKLFSLLT